MPAVAGTGLCLLALAGPAGAITRAADLRATTGVKLVLPPGTQSRVTVAPAGDVNGDGRADIVVGVPDLSAQGRPEVGAAYVVFGRPGRRVVRLEKLGTGGFRIDGAPSIIETGDSGIALGDHAGTSVAAAGDVNGDGLADVLVGAPGASARRRVEAGAVYVVFGKRTHDPVDLAALGDGGYRIDGDKAADKLGRTVANAGDVNGDGLPDAVMGTERSGAYVVFGRAGSGGVDLRILRAGGLRLLLGPDPWVDDPEGYSAIGGVSAAGDVNGDGLQDVVVAVKEPLQARWAGIAYVVFGRMEPGTVFLRALGPQGFPIRSRRTFRLGTVSSGLGEVAAAAGDVNGDGLGDLVLMNGDDSSTRRQLDRAHVVFGQRRPRAVDIERLGRSGFTIRGRVFPTSYATSTATATGAGDLDGDGLADIAIGMPEFDRACRFDLGGVFVVRGSRRTAGIDLAGLGARGLRLEGRRAGGRVGEPIAAAGDVNGDGRPDLMVGARSEGRAIELDFVTALPGRPARRREVSAPRCLRMRIVDRDIGEIVDSGRLRAEVSLRRLQSRRAERVRLELHAERSDLVRRLLGRVSIPPTPTPPPLATGSVRFRRAGKVVVALRLTKWGRGALESKRAVRVRLEAKTGRHEMNRSIKATLRLGGRSGGVR